MNWASTFFPEGSPPVTTRPSAISGSLAEALDNPRRAARSALDFLHGTNGAHSSAVFTVRNDGQLRLFVSNGIDQDALEQAQALWDATQPALQRGEVQSASPSTAGGRTHVLAPLRQGGELVALLYLDSLNPRLPELLDRTSLERFGSVLVESVTSPDP